MFKVKAFYFEKYGADGLNILVREAAADNGPVLADVVLDGQQLANLYKYLGLEVPKPKSSVVEVSPLAEVVEAVKVPVKKPVEKPKVVSEKQVDENHKPDGWFK